MQRTYEIGLFAAIVVAVGGFGGTEPISWGVAQALILALGLLLVANPANNSSRSIGKVHWIPVAIVGLVAVQWAGSLSGKIGVDMHSIETSGLTLVTIIVAFYIALHASREPRSCKRLAASLVFLGVIEAIYGLAQYLAGWQYVWNIPRRFYIGSATGTYVNHNHFAGFIEMIFPLTLGLSFYYWQRPSGLVQARSARDLLLQLGHPDRMKSLLLLLAAATLFLAIVFSLSRMGMISMFVSIGVITVTLFAAKRGPISAVLILLLVTGAVAAAAWVGAGPIVEHFEQLNRDEMPVQGTEGRAALWEDTLHLIGGHPWTGVGLGSFEFAFTKVQSIRLTYVADHAHNDYLELAAELGLPAAAVLFSVLFWLAGKTFRASLVSRSSLARALALGSLGGIIALLFHSAADFNLYIPANALVFAVLLGMGYAMSQGESAREAAQRLRGAREVPTRQADAAQSLNRPEQEKVEIGINGPRSS